MFVNNIEMKILVSLFEKPFRNQRMLADQVGYSLGMVNQGLRALNEAGYLDEQFQPTEEARNEIKNLRPRNAVILAAGFGMRMVPINTEIPKGLLQVQGECLIERTIKQLREAGVQNICVVVGFLKEMYEYLIDEYDVELIVNPEYVAKNNLHSIKYALDYLDDCYVVPCDLWCEENPFKALEPYSWYMVSDEVDDESTVRVNRKRELVTVSNDKSGNAMVGIAYIAQNDAAVIRQRVLELVKDPHHDGDFWESALFEKDKMLIPARVMSAAEVVEINTYEQLRELDAQSNQLNTDAIQIIQDAFHASADEIVNIRVLKKGMTNRSFLFELRNKKYIMRIPGEGTDQLINRAEEASVYRAIADENFSDRVIYMNPQNGYKITEYMEGARNCDPLNEEDLVKCMAKVRQLHQRKLKVAHEFDIFKKIDFYESLWNGQPSVYRDYTKTKARVLELKQYIDQHAAEKVLTHIDAVPDNFLFAKNADGTEELRLIDWEYAAMQDPHVDIAMFCIYALYDREQVDHLINLYFEGNCPEDVRTKIYCYISACGLLWSNWCEYKRNLGVEFGEYSLRQYRYAKDYYKLAKSRMEK